MQQRRPPITAVIGPGAIGATIAAVLTRSGNRPVIAGRTPRSALRLLTVDGDEVRLGPVLGGPETVPSPVDIVFLAVKATQTSGTAGWLAALCGPGTVVCVLQNGVEQLDTVRPLVPDGTTVLPAVVWFPARRSAPDTVQLLDRPRLTVPDTPGARAVRDVLSPGCAVDVTDDFRTEAWRKLLQNAVAGLMVLTGRRSGVFTREDVGALATDYLTECLAVARADGAQLGDDEPGRVLARFRSFPSDRGTSILDDREAGRPLEWDVRNGVVRRLGRAYGVPTPISDTLVPLLAAASDGPG